MVDSGFGDRGSIRDAVVIERVGPATAVVQGRPVDAFVFHDYLGLSQRKEVLAAAGQSLEQFGLNLCAVRPQGGYTPLHQQLEREIAAFVGKDDAVVFSSGSQATVAGLEMLAQSAAERCLSPQGVFVCADEAVQPHLLAPAYQLKVTQRDFAHNSPWSLRKVMISRKVEQYVLFSYGVYSMHADVAPLDKYLDIAEECNAYVLMDDAHGIGTIGDHLGGLADHYALARHPRLIISGSFSKALGGSGGFVAGTGDFCSRIRCLASGCLHSQSVAPCLIAGMLAALRIMRKDGLDLREQMRRNIAHARAALKNEGIAVQGASAIPCMTIAIGDDETAIRIRDDLLREDLLISTVTRPSVDKGHARLRLVITASHRREQFTRL
ncbi:MAG: hypothetical protein C0409_14885, partial [Novosphingobium sp.]|nr:hypothetical protein [Novosphingobium sp.]